MSIGPFIIQSYERFGFQTWYSISKSTTYIVHRYYLGVKIYQITKWQMIDCIIILPFHTFDKRIQNTE